MIFKVKPTYDWMVVGLGNPGLEYEKTRHNIGFMAADLLSREQNFSFAKNRMNAVMGEYRLNDKRILVLKPQTYMNNSGRAVGAVSAFYKIPKDRIIIMHDDVSLDVGKIRMRRKGSDGGQRGMRDIIEVLGTDNIMRVKIGVGAKPHPDFDMVDWVLGRFPADQIEAVESSLKKTVLAINEIIARGIDSAMNKYNG